MEKVKNKIDLSTLDTVKGSNEGFDVKIYNPATNEDLGITITVLGKDSDLFLKTTRAQSKRRMEKLQKGSFRNASLSPEEHEIDSINLLAEVTTGWKTLAVKDKKGDVVKEEKDTLTISEKEVEFSKENAVNVYKCFPWIREQIDSAVGDRANFISS